MNTETFEIREVTNEELALLNRDKPNLWVPIENKEFARVLRKLSKKERKVVMSQVEQARQVKAHVIEQEGLRKEVEQEHTILCGLLVDAVSALGCILVDFQDAAPMSADDAVSRLALANKKAKQTVDAIHPVFRELSIAYEQRQEAIALIERMEK
jgi:hypothetical protein